MTLSSMQFKHHSSNMPALRCSPLETTGTVGKFPCYIILSNIQSGNNIGDICRNALAFNVAEVIVIGRDSFRSKMRGADRGAKSRLVFVNCATVQDTKEYLLNATNNAVRIIGVEIHPEAKPITSIDFCGPTAFVFGNEGGGLSPKQRAICDGFVYIPQYAAGGMASINVACASAIVLQTFAVAAGYQESTRLGEKFV